MSLNNMLKSNESYTIPEIYEIIHKFQDQIDLKTPYLWVKHISPFDIYNEKQDVYIRQIFYILNEKDVINLDYVNQMMTHNHLSIAEDKNLARIKDILLELPTQLNNSTLLRVVDTHFLAKIIENMIKNNTPFNDAGFEHVCRHMKTRLHCYIDNIFKHYTPPREAILWTLNQQKCLNIMMQTFNIKITIDDVEQFCLESKIVNFQRIVPKEIKLTLKCLHNACVNPNLSTIRQLVEYYNIKPDEHCLELVIPSLNHAVISYLLERVKVSTKSIKIIMDNIKLNKTYRAIYNKWKSDSDVLQNEQEFEIEGIDNI